MQIVQKYMTKSKCYKANQKMTPKGLVLHSVACPQPSAEVFQKLYNASIDLSMHGFIDAEKEGYVIETLPQNINGWHVGGSANKTHLGFEMCEPKQLVYNKNGSAFTVADKDLPAAQKACKIAYNTAVEYFAYLCKKYGFNPLKSGVIISHNEAGKQGIGSCHIDPEHLWKGLKMPYTMDGFRKDVSEAMYDKKSQIYRVQIGAFKSKVNADAYVVLAKAKGFNAIRFYDNGIYRVQVGAFKSQANATAYKKDLVKAGFKNAFVEP